jgi:hypothetical protein
MDSLVNVKPGNLAQLSQIEKRIPGASSPAKKKIIANAAALKMTQDDFNKK